MDGGPEVDRVWWLMSSVNLGVSMLGAVLHESPGQLSVEEVWIDQPAPGEVLIRTAATGLCHSDLHYMEWAFPLEGPTLLGHEGAGVVEAVGEGVTYVQPGDHAIVFTRGLLRRVRVLLVGTVEPV